MMRVLLWCCLLFANRSMASDWKDVSSNITGSLDMVTQFVVFACLLVGVFCLFAAFVKYFAYRRNPLAAPFSTVMWLLMMALILMAVPVLHVVSGHNFLLLDILNPHFST